VVTSFQLRHLQASWQQSESAIVVVNSDRCDDVAAGGLNHEHGECQADAIVEEVPFVP
jgi:hypothetical protein